ncbi:MAG: hypothetical protein GY755_07740 [Chloroflexi bacterium]|nr:hypothetical protein [Chloroflexota bacterium]
MRNRKACRSFYSDFYTRGKWPFACLLWQAGLMTRGVFYILAKNPDTKKTTHHGQLDMAQSANKFFPAFTVSKLPATTTDASRNSRSMNDPEQKMVPTTLSLVRFEMQKLKKMTVIFAKQQSTTHV